MFFPKAWSPVCPTEVKAFSARLEEFLYNRACAVLFVSTDSADCLRAWSDTSEANGGLGGVHMPLISDCNHVMSRAYGTLIEESGLTQRALFVIDPQGMIRAISSIDSYVARNVDDVIRLLDALIFKDENGEACPAGWQKGDEGLDISKDRVEGPLSVELKKTWTDWARPKLTRAFSGTSQRSNSSVPMPLAIAPSTPSARSCVSYNGQSTPPTERMPGVSSSFKAPSTGQLSPLLSTPLLNVQGADYFSATNASNSRMGTQLEEAILQQRMENINATLQNYRRSQEFGTTATTA